jgi:N-acyl-D-amino-acid deacylase
LRALRDKGFSFWDALRKMTVMPANVMRLRSGRLYEGARADIIAFDPDAFKDAATFHEPFAPAEGLRLVVINGKTAYKDCVMADEPYGDLKP